MAIIYNQADGSNQHYDTYEEFEQAFILLKRLNGEKVPQDLLDEAKAKNSGKETKPFDIKLDATKVAEAIEKIVEELDGHTESDESEESSPIEVGDEVRVIYSEDGSGTPFHGFKLGSIVTVTDLRKEGRLEATNGVISQTLLPGHFENLEARQESPTEFHSGDVVKVTESITEGGSTVEAGLAEIEDGNIRPASLIRQGEDLATLKMGSTDNTDKIRLVCRKEDRKDIEL